MPTPNLDVSRFLESLSATHARAYTAAVQDMVVAMARGNRPQFVDARDRLARITTETMGAAEILGASLVLQQAAKVGAGQNFADSPQPILPKVTFTEALEDMVRRAPVTIRNAAERTAQRIAQLYGESPVTAFAFSAEQAVTERVQALIKESIQSGLSEIGAGKLIKETVDQIRTDTAAWSESYARMAFRTNVNTAVTAGRFRQVQDPDIAAVIPAFRFDAVGDRDTRDNHGASDGLIFKVDNQVWRRIAPPLGYNCRCQVTLMSRPQLRRMGRLTDRGEVIEDRAIPPGAGPDEGFRHGGRPDLFLNAVS